MSWIKLHRKFLRWEWYEVPEMVQLFVWLLLNAAHEDTPWQGRTIYRGQVLTGRRKLAEALHTSEKKVRTCLERLKSTGEITTDGLRGANGFTLITICNYERYQCAESGEGPIKGQLRANLRANLTANLASSSTSDKPAVCEKQVKEVGQLNGQLEDPKRAIYNKNKEYIVVDDSRTREEAIKKLRCDFQSSPLKIEAAMRATRITDAAQLFNLCDEVFADWSLRNDGSVDWPHLRSQLIIKAEAQRRDAKRLAAIPEAKKDVQQWRRDFMQDYTAYINNQLKNKDNGTE